ncbi:MAG: acyl-ACP--UDP-N-acetylglucosamine O-acyltransferase [Pseudomonadota bacterium]
MTIHPTAIVENGAQLGDDVDIGPYCIVGANVSIGDGSRLHSHVTIAGRTSIGPGAIIHPFVSLGGPPQHLGYKGEDTALQIGANVIIREHTTMNIGTADGGGVTRIGDNGMFMTGAHVAHDCVVADNVIFANNATLGGHVRIAENVFIGGMAAIHQHCRIGANAFVGGCAAVSGDVIPFGSAFGNHARLMGLNIIGLKRRGLSRKAIHELRAGYRMLFEGEGAFRERLPAVRDAFGENVDVAAILDFIEEDGARSIMGPAR